MDDFNREALSVEIGRSLSASKVIRVLEWIAARRSYPAQIRMGNGPDHCGKLGRLGIATWRGTGFIQLVCPMQNGFIERFNRSYREGVLNMYVFKTLSDVRERTEA